MAHHINPDGCDAGTYRGLAEIFEFRNGDGDLRKFNCGQAAACTLLTYHGRLPTTADPDLACEVLRLIETDHPPDNVGGWFGTSRRRVERICQAHGIDLEEVNGEAELRERLDRGQPVIVMVGTEGPRLWRWTAPAGHWMVAFGYDDRYLYLTNGAAPGMPWDEFRGWWGSLVPRLISMRNRGLAAVAQEEPS